MEPANLIRYKKDFIITTNIGILNMIFLRTEFRIQSILSIHG